MSPLEAAFLGVIQGITEFLPISSDGHLALGFMVLGEPFDLEFVVFLHFATLLAMFAYFWKDVLSLLQSLLPANAHRKADRRLVALIAAGTAVSAVIALALEPVIEPAAENRVAIAAGFFLTSALLTAGELFSKRARAAEARTEVDVDNAGEREVEHAASEMAWPRAIVIAVLQGIAALPGVSRSGSTTAGGMLAGLKREDAARYSFLLGIPIITLAAAKDGLDLLTGTGSLPPVPTLVAGFLGAAIAGYAAIWGLLKLVKNHTLLWFAAYTAVAGILLLVIQFNTL